MTTSSRRVAILGFGGHASVIADAVLDMGWSVEGFAFPNGVRGASGPFGRPVLGDDEDVYALQGSGLDVANGVGAVADRSDPGTSLRERIYESFVRRGFHFPPVVAAGAMVARDVTCAPGVQILKGAVVQTGARLLKNAVINTSASIDHHCVIGEHAFVSPGAVLCGGVTVGAGAFIGAGATILPKITIGLRVVVAAGATVRRAVADRGFQE